MAVVDGDELLAVRLHVAERAELLARIDRVARHRCRMRVRAPDGARRACVASGEEPARFLRRIGRGVGDDLVPQRRWQRELLDQRPPAIAGMTMTSLPSGTVVSRPPE